MELGIGCGLRRFPIGDDVDDDAGAAVVDDCGTVGTPALTRKSSTSGGKRAECVGAALRQGARVVPAHHAGHRAESLTEQRGVRGEQPVPHTGVVPDSWSSPMVKSRVRTDSRATHCARIDGIDPHVQFGDRGVLAGIRYGPGPSLGCDDVDQRGVIDGLEHRRL
jgi:hypothetical protein